jgi:hypothetical protein
MHHDNADDLKFRCHRDASDTRSARFLLLRKLIAGGVKIVYNLWLNRPSCRTSRTPANDEQQAPPRLQFRENQDVVEGNADDGTRDLRLASRFRSMLKSTVRAFCWRDSKLWSVDLVRFAAVRETQSFSGVSIKRPNYGIGRPSVQRS